MAYLLDSNILLRLFVPADPYYEAVRHALRTLRQRDEQRYYVSQCLAEFWNVATRPATARGGYGLSVVEADRRVRVIERVFTLLPEREATHPAWRQLLVSHFVSGVQVYDARLVAAMQVNAISYILTLNPSDFARFGSVTAVHPNAL